jgi:uncharacterized protein YjbI with pentapeptide repeats
MRVVKPNQVSLLCRPYDFKNQYRLCVTGLVLFPFGAPGYPLSEAALWTLAGEQIGATPLDESMPKVQGEILICGSAHAPGGTPHKVVRVAVELDGKPLKELAVVGDRVWKNGVPTEPEPFVEKPIRWDGAFGGEKFKKNPVGKGHEPRDGSPLPNIEDRRTLLTSMSQTPEPVGFMPLDISWPQRLSKAGSYDQHWLDKYYPGLALDIDWSFFNVAPPDQRIEGFFRGDEELTLKNLHPTEASLTCKLPAVQLRCFMRRKKKSGEEEASEIALELDTLWLFPGAAQGVLVYHGVAPIREDDAADVSVLCLACEDLGQPKPLKHYEDEIERRLAHESGATAALDDLPLMPPLRGGLTRPPTPGDELTDLATPENLIYKNLKRKEAREIDSARAMLVAHGLDPDGHGPKHLPEIDYAGPPDQVMAESSARMAHMSSEEKQAADLAERDARMRKRCEDAGVDFDEIKKEWEQPAAGPPELVAEDHIARMRNLADAGRAVGADVSEIDDYLADPKFVDLIYQHDRSLMEAYRLGAQLQGEPSLRPEAESRRIREELLAAHGRGESLKGRNLTGVNLSGIDLAGADLEEALMERCNLAQANLAGAQLKRAVLVRANLRGTCLDRADLERCNLSKAELAGTTLAGARLVEVILDDTELVQVTLDGVLLERATMAGTKLLGCSFRNAQAEGLVLDKLDLSDSTFAGANLETATFTHCTLDAVDFAGARLKGVTLYACRGKRATFAGADARSLRVVEGTVLEECDFRGANLGGSTMRATKLQRCDFTDAVAPLVDFSDSDLEGARLYHLKAKQGRFIRTILHGANLVGADLYEALLSKALLHGADLRGANLYQADMAMAVGDENTHLDDAMIVRVRSKPRWQDKVQDLD